MNSWRTEGSLLENATFELDIVGCAGFMFTKQNERQMAIPWEGGGGCRGLRRRGTVLASPIIKFSLVRASWVQCQVR